MTSKQIVLSRGFGTGTQSSTFTVRTSWDGETQSDVRLRTTDVANLLDIELTEFVGLSRRRKCTSVRLMEEATRQLYEMLRLRFEGQAGDVRSPRSQLNTIAPNDLPHPIEGSTP